MASYVAKGKVYPESYSFNWSDVPTTAHSNGIQIELKISVIDSIIEVAVECPEPIDIPTLRNIIKTAVDGLANLVGFFECQTLSAEINEIIDTQNQDTLLELTGHNYVFDGVSIFGEKITFPKYAGSAAIRPYALNNTFLMRAIYELRQSSQQPDYTALHSYLAIDSIRNTFSNSKSEGWAEMRSALNMTETTLTHFKEAADEQRHGRNLAQSWSQRQQAMQIAWEVVWRYFIYTSEGKQPLSKEVFPEF